MPKLRLLFLPLLVGIWLYFVPSKVLADTVNIGGFEVKVVNKSGYDSTQVKRDFDLGNFTVTYELTGDQGTVIHEGPFNLEDACGFNWDRCIKATQYTFAETIKPNERVKFTKLQIDHNNTQDIGQTPLQLVSASNIKNFSTDTVLGPGDSTGVITWEWDPTGIVSPPNITITPATVSLQGSTNVNVTIDLGSRLGPAYTVYLGRSENLIGPVIQLQILCSNSKDRTNPGCNLTPQGGVLDAKDSGATLNGTKLTFNAPSSTLGEGTNYVVVTGEYITQQSKTFSVEPSIINDVQPNLNPSSLDTKDSSSASITLSLGRGSNAKYSVILPPADGDFNPIYPEIICDPSKSCSVNIILPKNGLAPGTYEFIVEDGGGTARGKAYLNVLGDAVNRPGGPGSTVPTYQPPQACEGDCTTAAGRTCDPTSSNPTADNRPDPKHAGVYTAIGCIPTNPELLIAGILRFVTGISGGIALLLMAFGAIGMITSAGNAEALKASQERFYNAIIGLVFIILSVALLRIIGVDILQIPGFR